MNKKSTLGEVANNYLTHTKKNKGITLVALIITIVVMLILVAVSVNVLIKSNLIGTSENAVDKYKNASEEETNSGTIEINGKKYDSIEDYMEGKEKLPDIDAGIRAETNSNYKGATIPKGFTVSGIKSEQTIEGGLVIYDIPEGTTVDWTNPDSVKTAYNQFVWIPVEVTSEDTEEGIAGFARTEWIVGSSGFQEKRLLNSSYSYFDILPNQVSELTKSIYKYGGFWIGRYEAGSETERTEESSQTAQFVVQQDKYPYNYIEIASSQSDANSVGAVKLCNNLYNSKKYGAKSMLCTGVAWDSMLDFLNSESYLVYDSYNWGNYWGNGDYSVNRGAYATKDTYYCNASLSKFNNIEESYSPTKWCLLTTGATERNCNKNIYDVAGNCYELTTENNGDRFISRGGQEYQRYGNEQRASNRTAILLDMRLSSVSFRPILYVFSN